MASRATAHNRLAEEFVSGAVRQVINAGGSACDVMVLLESVVLAGMLVNARQFGVEDRLAVEMAETAVHRATERFVASRAEGKGHG